MNQILSGLAGAVILAVGYFSVVLARKIGKGATALTAALNGIPALVKTNQEVAKALNRFSGELEFLRTVVTGGNPEPAPGDVAPAPPKPRGGPLPQFPAWIPSIATPDVPDAEEADTEVIETTDEELVEQEQLDEIRGQGFAAGPEADPTQNPPGVEASV